MTATTTTAEEAIGAIRTGDTVMVGGFGLVGAPLTLIDALVEHSDATELTIVSNNIGEPGRGLGKLLRQGRIRRGISSYFTSNPEAVAAVNAGEIEATLVPQGTFAEAIRAAGAGIGGFFTPVGAGTLLAEGKEERVIDGVRHVLEEPIRADVALVYAARADTLGNLWYRRTARNFNPLMATAATVTIAEAGEIVAGGRARGRVGRHAAPVRRPARGGRMSGDAKARIAARAALELRPGRGRQPRDRHPEPHPGLPRAPTRASCLHTENGLLGVGPRPDPDELDPDLIDAAKQPITALPGAAYFDSAIELRDDPRRPRRRRRARRAAGERRGRHRQLGRAGEGRARRRRRDGPRRRRAPGDRHDDRDDLPRRAEGRRPTAPIRSRRAAPPTSSSPSCRSSACVDGGLHLTELLDGATLEDVGAVTTAPFVVALEESHVR